MEGTSWVSAPFSCPQGATGRALLLQDFGQPPVVLPFLAALEFFLYSPFLCPILCQYIFALSEVRENCSSGGHMGTQHWVPWRPNSKVIWGLKGPQFGTWSHWLKWQVHFFLCYWHGILSCPSGLIFVLTRRKVSVVQRRAVLPALITKPAGLLLKPREVWFFLLREI